MNPLRRFPLSVAAIAAFSATFGHAQSIADSAVADRAVTLRAWQQFAAQSHRTLATLHASERDPSFAAPEGVAELAFAELFGPVGDRGLEFSAKLRALAGRRVRLVGCMVRELTRTPGGFLLAARPATAESRGNCSAEVVPASAVQVVLAGAPSRPVPYRPGWLALTGRIELGLRVEADGRNSFVRLVLAADAFDELFLP